MSVSKECSEGRHADCTLGGMVCDCTARGGHTTQHRYVNASVSKPEKLQPVASVGETLNLTPNDRCTCSTLSSHCVKHGTKVSFGASVGERARKVAQEIHIVALHGGNVPHSVEGE